MSYTDPRQKARQHLQRARQLVAESSSVQRFRSEEALIAAIRKTREQLWEAKLAARP